MSLVVGIDIGNENCVVAAYNSNSSGGFVDVLLNEASKRETPLIIHFDKKQRLFGSAAASYSSRNPQATISQLKRLIGRHYDEVSFQRERHLLPYETCKGENGEILVTVDYQKQKWYFTAVELLGMFLSHLKKTAEKASGDKQITDCVIGIPSYLTNQQRKDYLMAAEIAGLKPLRLFHDGTATALDYASSREIPYGEVIHVVFVDIGHCDTQVTVVKFCCGTLTVLAHSFNRDLGGRDFDNLIFEFIRKIFHQKRGIDILQNVKASFQLRAACAKAKLVLSVNTEATVSKECLIGDIDVEETITRETFENISTDLMVSIVTTCKKALTDAGLAKKEIHSVELVGSGSRIPKISQVLEDFFEQKISRTLNASECIANGCALQCAMLCPTLKARTFGVQDIYPFTVVCKASKNVSLEPCNGIAKGLLFLSTKTFVLHLGGHEFRISFHYSEAEELRHDAASIITGYKMTLPGESKKPNVEIILQLNIHGILTLISSSVVSKGFEENPVEMDIDVVGERSKSLEDECASSRLLSSKIGDVRERSTAHPFEFVEISYFPQIVLEDVLANESKLDELDRACECAKSQRNHLEACLLGMRNAILGKPLQFASEESKKAVLALLSQVEEWLYGDGADESVQVYIDAEKNLTSAYDGLYSEHVFAIEEATEEKRRLVAFAVHINEKVRRRDLGRLTKEEQHELFLKLRHILSLRDEVGVRTQEEYNREHKELKSLCCAIERRLKEEAGKSSMSQPGFVRSVWSGLWSGSAPQTSVQDSCGDQMPVTETTEIPDSNEQSLAREDGHGQQKALGFESSDKKHKMGSERSKEHPVAQDAWSNQTPLKGSCPRGSEECPQAGQYEKVEAFNSESSGQIKGGATESSPLFLNQQPPTGHHEDVAAYNSQSLSGCDSAIRTGLLARGTESPHDRNQSRLDGYQSGTKVAIQPTQSPSFSDQGKSQPGFSSNHNLGDGTTITVEESRVYDKQNVRRGRASYEGGNLPQTVPVQQSQISKKLADGVSSNRGPKEVNEDYNCGVQSHQGTQQVNKGHDNGVSSRRGPEKVHTEDDNGVSSQQGSKQPFSENPWGGKSPGTGDVRKQKLSEGTRGSQGLVTKVVQTGQGFLPYPTLDGETLEELNDCSGHSNNSGEQQVTRPLRDQGDSSPNSLKN